MDKSCLKLLELLQDTVNAKRDGAERAELKGLLTQAALEIIKIRQAARQQVEAVEKAKAATLESRAEVDTANLQLQNLLYEKNYYSREIASCESFRSKYTDEEVGLIPEQRFREEAPSRFQEGIDDPHKLQLQRLEHEKHLRLELLKDLEKVKQRKAEHNQVVIGKRKRLEELRKQVAALQTGAAPLREQLGLPPPREKRQRAAAAAATLPLPLYIVYHQLTGVQEAFGEDVEVEIVGSDKEAEPVAADAGEDAPDGISPGARKRRKSSLDTKAEAPAAPEYTTHPLSVRATIGGRGGKPLQLQLHWLPRLEVVTARATDPEQQPLLAAAYPGDSGSQLPNEAPLQAAADFAYDPARPDRPYLWAQHLAGLDFLPELTSVGSLAAPGGATAVAQGMVAYRRQGRVRDLLARLRAAAPAAVPAAAGAREADPRAQPVARVSRWEAAAAAREALPSPPVSAPVQGQEAAAARLAAIREEAARAAAAESDEEGELPSEIS